MCIRDSCKLTGEYDETVTEDMVYEKLLEVMDRDAKALAAENSSGQHFRYVETPLITAIPVSYTHLDVYKRQLSGDSSEPCGAMTSRCILRCWSLICAR